ALRAPALLPELARPGARRLEAGLLRIEPSSPDRDQGQARPQGPLSLRPEHPAPGVSRGASDHRPDATEVAAGAPTTPAWSDFAESSARSAEFSSTSPPVPATHCATPIDAVSCPSRDESRVPASAD